MEVLSPPLEEIRDLTVGFRPQYDLDPSEMGLLTRELLSNLDVSEGKFVCAEFGGTDLMSNIGRTVEREVFEHSFGNTTEVMEQEYGPYEDPSRFLVVFDRSSQQPAGVLRLIENSERGLKSLNDVESAGLLTKREFQESTGIEDLDDCWEVGTLAVMPRYRGMQSMADISALLYRGAMRVGTEHGIENTVTVLDDKAFGVITAMGIPWKDVTEPFSYLGSGKSHLAYTRSADIAPGLEARAAELQEASHEASGAAARLYKFMAHVAIEVASGDGLDARMQLLR